MNTRRERNKEQNRQINTQMSIPAKQTKEKDTNFIELGKYFYTLSHLVFGGVVIAILLDFSDRKFLMLIYGALAVVTFAIMGWFLIRKGNIK